MESWRNRKTLILSRQEMMGLLTPAEYNACVEQAYRMHGERRFYMDPKGHIVLDKYPVKSIKDISLGGGLVTLVTGGPWKAKIMKVGGQEISLDDIEHGVLRPVHKDPRVHYAVNCASFGCPNLGTEALTGAKLDAQLDAAAKAFVNHPRGIKVEDGKATASSIYTWFQKDFGGTDKGVLDHVRKYAGPELKAKLEKVTSIAGYDYDWSINEAK